MSSMFDNGCAHPSQHVFDYGDSGWNRGKAVANCIGNIILRNLFAEASSRGLTRTHIAGSVHMLPRSLRRSICYGGKPEDTQPLPLRDRDYVVVQAAKPMSAYIRKWLQYISACCMEDCVVSG